MFKQNISIKKSILYTVLLGLVTLSSTAMAVEPELYYGVTDHYQKGKEFYSPVLGQAGLDSGLIENIRKWGPFIPAFDKDGNRYYVNDSSPDPLWSVTMILFPSPGGQFGTFVDYSNNFGKHVKDPKVVAALLAFTNDIREHRKIDINKSANDIAGLCGLTQKRKANFKNQTVKPLLENIKKAIEQERDSIFPAYTTEQVIETFFAHKFNKREDVENLIKAMPDDIVDPKVPFVSKPLSAEEILKPNVLKMDDLLALSALEMAAAPIPYQSGISPISNERARHYDRGTDKFKEGVSPFADCVDIMARHMATMLLYNLKTKEFDLTPLRDQQKKFQEGSPQFKRLQNAIEFFEKYKNPVELATASDIETRSWWNRVVAGLNLDEVEPKVAYNFTDNELIVGHINMLRMFQNLFSLDLDPFPVLEVVNEADPEKEKETLIQLLQKGELEAGPFPVLEVKAEATPEQVQEAQKKLDKDILSWKVKARETIRKKFEEDRIKWILNSFNKVFSFMNPGFVYDCEPKDLRWSPARNDAMGNITVAVKMPEGSSEPLYSFIMNQWEGQQGTHGAIYDIYYLQKQTVLEGEAKKTLIKPGTAEESLWLLFPRMAKTKTTAPLYKMMYRRLDDNDSKIEFISTLAAIAWQNIPHLAAQEIAGFLSNILPTLSWDDPGTLPRITSFILAVFLDETGKLKEAVPQEVREAFFRQTQSLEFERAEFPGAMPNFARILPYFQNDVLQTQSSKMSFLQGLNGLNWSEVSEENTSKIERLLSTTLDTFSWDDPDTLHRVTNSIVAVFLDKDEKLKETVPQEIGAAFFKQTQALEFVGSMKPNFAVVLVNFQNNVLQTQSSKMSFLQGLNGLDWSEVSEENTSKITGVLSKVLDTLGWDGSDTLRRITSSILAVFLDETGKLKEAVPQEVREVFFKQTQSLEFQEAIKPNFMQLLLKFKHDVLKTQSSKMSFLQGLRGLNWSEVSEENTSKMAGVLSKVLDTFSGDGSNTLQLFTTAIRSIILDKDENLNETLPPEIRETIFSKTQSLEVERAGFLGVIKPNFARVLPYFKNDVLKTQNLKTLFLEGLSHISWKEIPEENTSKIAGLLSNVLDTLKWNDPNTLRRNTNSIRDILLGKAERLEDVPQQIQDAFFDKTQALHFFGVAISTSFVKVLPYFKKDVLRTPDLKKMFVNSLRYMNWKEVSEGDILGIAGMLSKVLDAFPWNDPAALTRSIMTVLLDDTGSLNPLLPREIQETFFNKTQSLVFQESITSDFFLALSKILPQFVQAKDKVKQLTISGGEGKIEEFPECFDSLTSLTLKNVKVGTAALEKLPSLNSLSFEGITLDRLVIDPAHSKLNVTAKLLSVSEIQGLENLDIFQETLSSEGSFLSGIQNLEVIKFTNPNHKLGTLVLRGDQFSRIEGLNNLPNLRVLDLSRSNVTSMGGFETLTQLKKLNLSGSQSQSLVFTDNHKTIEELDLNKVKLQNTQWIKPLTQLKRIAFLMRSEVDSLEFLPSHSSLEYLIVGNSSVNSIKGLGHLTSLERLALMETRNLTTLNFEGELPNLRAIEAHGNNDIEEIKGLDKLPKIETLYLNDTSSLKSLVLTGGNDSLKNISLKNSGVAVLEGVDTLPSLEKLFAGNTQNLKSVRFGPRNTKLEQIALSQTGVTSVEGVEELPALEGLYFTGSKSLASPIHFSEKNAKVSDVSLSDTAITQVSGLQHLTAVKTLDLSRLNLESLKLFPNLKDTKVALSGSSVGTLTGAEIYIKDKTSMIRKAPTRIVTVGKKMPPQLPAKQLPQKGVKELKIGYNAAFGDMKHIGKIVFVSPDKLLKELHISGLPPFSIDRVKGLEKFENLELIDIKNVILSSLNFTQDLEKLQRILIEGGQLDELTGLEHLPALKEVTVPAMAPRAIDLPEDVNFTHQQSPRAENRPDITTFKRPAAGKTHEENE